MQAVDSLATPQGGAIGMSKLVNVDGAVYVLVGFTGVSKAAAPIGARAKTILVNGGGVGPDLAGLTPYFWNIIPLANIEVAALVPWLMAKQIKRIAAIYIDDPFGNGVMDALKSSLGKAGGSVAAPYSISPTDQEFAAVAAKLRAVKPDAVYFASYGAQQAVIIKQLRNNGITQQLLSYSGVDIPSVRALPQANGLVFTAQAHDWDSPDPVTRRFVQDWRAKYHTDPTPYHQNYYNAVRLFALLAQANEKQGKAGGRRYAARAVAEGAQLPAGRRHRHVRRQGLHRPADRHQPVRRGRRHHEDRLTCCSRSLSLPASRPGCSTR